MDTITAVVEIVRENEEMRKSLEQYEDMCEGLIGQTVTFSHKRKNKTRYVTCEVEEFDLGTAEWLVRDIESDEVYPLTFDKLFDGSVTINKMPEPVERPKRTVTFVS
jgi:hypothetical protein